MGGEAISLAVNYTHSTEFRSSGYAPFMVNGTEYGESRQYGNFSFTRIYEAGHDVPFYQPSASLELFRRVLHNLAVSDGARM
jgi:carboxypeptidase C (cathepsin A)